LNVKVAAVGLVIAILVVAVLLSGVIPGFHLPQKAQLISVSSVNIQPGGSIQNSYVVGTDWYVALTVNSFQNVAALELGPSNQTTCGSGTVCSGQTVAPTSQVYITLTPGQPYVSVNLIPVQSGNGFSNPIVSSVCGYGNNLTGINGFFQDYFQGKQICTNSLNSEFYVPTSQFWTPHYPVTISVQVVGGSSPAKFSQTVDIVNMPSNILRISNPSNPDQNITINNLGSLLGNEWPTDVGNLLFYQGGSKCQGWCAFGSPSSDAQAALGRYADYWFGSEPSFLQSTGVSTPDPTYYSSSCTSPGWGQVYGYTLNALGQNLEHTYFYYPINPSLTTPASSINATVKVDTNDVGETQYAHTNQCAGEDLTDYLYSHTTAFQNTYGKSLGWSISSNGTLTMPLPNQAVASVSTPAITILIPTSLANTILYQVNNAQFKITAISASSTTVTAGGYTTVTGTIENSGTISGTPQLNYYGNNLFDLSGLSLTTLNPGQSEPFSLTATGLNTLLSSKNTITFYVENDAGQVTDTRQLTLTDRPPASLGVPSFAIQGIKGSSTVGVGSEITLTVEISSQGAAGTAYLSSSSENNQVSIVSPETQNVTIGGTNTEGISFYVTGVTAGNTTIYFAVSNGQGQSQTVQTAITVTGSSSGPCVVDCNPNNPSSGIPLLDVVVGAVLIIVAVVIGVWYFRRNH